MESIIAFIITALALGFVGLPLFRERKQDEALAADGAYLDPEADSLLSRKDIALTAIRELEFDYAVGNLSDDDYRELKEKYEKRAISLLKTLDEVGEKGTNGRDRRADRRMATAARARREARRQVKELACPACGEPHDAEDRFCRGCGAELDVSAEEALRCPNCGEPYEEEDVFCGACGGRLAVVAEQPGSTAEESPRGEAAPRMRQAPRAQQDGAHLRRRTRRARQGRSDGNGKDSR